MYKASDFGNWSRVLLVLLAPGDRFELVTRADFTLASYGEVKARPAAGEEAPQHVVHLKLHAIHAIRVQSELHVTIRESQSRGSGASLDVPESSMPAKTSIPGA